MKYAVAPGESMEIQVTAKKWLWQFEYPDGSRTVNDIHVPVNKPVKFVMTSEDVLHDFYVPDMRVKHDIVPGRYTANLVYAHRARRAHCHLRRILRQGPLRHDGQADRRQRRRISPNGWKPAAPSGRTHTTRMADWGKMQCERKGCNTCHTVDGTNEQGSELEGHLRQDGEVERRQAVLVDEALYPGIDDAAAGQSREGIRADHADVPGPVAANRKFEA